MTSQQRRGTSLENSVTDALRVIEEEVPTDGAWNMAVDEVLLETALSTGRATLRWYRWSEPTLSLGHFQAIDDPAIEERFAELPRVRRLSGGGAILHDQEWTYSLAVGPWFSGTSNAGGLYRLIHSAVIEVLQDFTIPARLRRSVDQSSEHLFLCFSRGDANDVVIGCHKVLGSAQRRRRGAVLQHGALLLRGSVCAAEFPGILDLAECSVNEANLHQSLVVRTAAAICPRWRRGKLDASELRRAEEIMNSSGR